MLPKWMVLAFANCSKGYAYLSSCWLPATLPLTKSRGWMLALMIILSNRLSWNYLLGLELAPEVFRHLLFLVGSLHLDPSTYEVTWETNPYMTPKEYNLLELLLLWPSRTESQCHQHLWSLVDPRKRILSRLISKACVRKLRQWGPNDLIETVHGVGYHLKLLS